MRKILLAIASILASILVWIITIIVYEKVSDFKFIVAFIGGAVFEGVSLAFIKSTNPESKRY
ncbi:hypothetical protein NE686_18100 [Tissierella carlieri]|uniref:Uncharacterized protein n=1 Tax=Tissierella carlieri TaxID=689904 RepID=A0ABT1SF33_9FIRM|nr:hypothetical protein [Tissierella carlieri]MCQ4925019.1 hypothetical protein [Tissierella carlieri]